MWIQESSQEFSYHCEMCFLFFLFLFISFFNFLLVRLHCVCVLLLLFYCCCSVRINKIKRNKIAANQRVLLNSEVIYEFFLNFFDEWDVSLEKTVRLWWRSGLG